MNRTRRKKLNDALALLERVSDIVESVMYEEQDSLDQVPENLQYTDRCERMENVIDKLTDAVDQLESAKESIAESVA